MFVFQRLRFTQASCSQAEKMVRSVMFLGLIPKAVLIYLLLSLVSGSGEKENKSNAIELAVMSTLLCGVFVFSLPGVLGLAGYPVAYVCGALVTAAAFHFLAKIEISKAVAFTVFLFVVDLAFFGLSLLFSQAER